MATQWKFRGFDVRVTYTVPAPAGFTAVKETVVIGDNVTKEQVAPLLIAIGAMMRDIADAFADADPYKGWAPFTFGTSVQPDWERIDTP